MYCGITISDLPRQIVGELYTNENAESYIEYLQNGIVVREEVFPGSIHKIFCSTKNTFTENASI